MKPTVTLSGTHRDTLLEAVLAACGKLREAIEAHKQTAPHHRDYWESAQYTVDQKEWRERDRKLREVLALLLADASLILGDEGAES